MSIFDLLLLLNSDSPDSILIRRGFIIVTRVVLEHIDLSFQFVTIPLSHTGNMPQSHTGINIVLTRARAINWLDLYRGGLPSARIWVVNIFTGELLETNMHDTLGEIFTWEDALASANLQVIEAEMI